MTIQRTSPIHRFFHDHAKGGKVCVECNRSFSINSNNTAWQKHLRTHPAQWKLFCTLKSGRREDGGSDDDSVPANVLTSSSGQSSSSSSTSGRGPFPVAAFRFPTVPVRADMTASADVVDLCHERSITPSASHHIGLRPTQQSINDVYRCSTF
jgi:hypothetical protein